MQELIVSLSYFVVVCFFSDILFCSQFEGRQE